MLWILGGIVAAGVAVAGIALLFVPSPVARAAGCLLLFAGAAGTAIAAVFVGGWLFFGGIPHRSTSLREFESELGVPATGDVRRFQLQATGSNDSVQRLATFEAAPSTIAAITARHFTRATTDACRRELDDVSGRRPDWWHVPPQGDCYVAEHPDNAFASTRAWLDYDPRTRKAWYRYEGID